MSSAAEQRQAELIRSLQQVAPVDEQQARFFLESSGWDLNGAVDAYFGNPPPPRPQTSSYPPSSSKPPVARSGNAPPRRIASLGGTSSDTDPNYQDVYTGGASSGMVVQDPQKDGRKTVERVFEGAKRAGAEAVGNEDATSQRDRKRQVRAFGGGGFRLGTDVHQSEAVAGVRAAVGDEEVKEVLRVITFYRNGFTVDGAEDRLRPYSEQEREFMQSIENGRCPEEFYETLKPHQTLGVNLVDKKTEEWKPPPKVLKPFTGSGNRLGDTPSSAAVAASSTTTTTATPAATPFAVDESKPKTTVGVRTWEGRKLTASVNLDTTIAQLASWVAGQTGVGAAQVILRTAFPPKVLADGAATVEQAGIAKGLVNAQLKK